MYDQAFLSLLFNKNLWRNLNIKQRSGMRPVRRLNSWLQKERSLSSCIRTQSITLTMSDQSLKWLYLSYESEYKRKKSDSLMLGGLQRMISFLFLFTKWKICEKNWSQETRFGASEKKTLIKLSEEIRDSSLLQSHFMQSRTLFIQLLISSKGECDLTTDSLGGMIISREKMQKGQSRIWSPEILRFQREEAVVW